MPDLSSARHRSAVPDPFASQWGWRVDGRDWPAQPVGVSLGEIFNALDGITSEVCEAARLSLLGLEDGAVADE